MNYLQSFVHQGSQAKLTSAQLFLIILVEFKMHSKFSFFIQKKYEWTLIRLVVFHIQVQASGGSVDCIHSPAHLKAWSSLSFMSWYGLSCNILSWTFFCNSSLYWSFMSIHFFYHLFFPNSYSQCCFVYYFHFFVVLYKGCTVVFHFWVFSTFEALK